MNKLAKTLLSRPEISALVMLLIVIVGFALYAPQFLSTGNSRVILFACRSSASWRSAPAS